MIPPQITPPPLSTQAMADLLCTIMLLCRGTRGGGRSFWAYMCIKPSMAKAFKDARDKGAFDLEQYGTIIEHGDGLEPPEEVRLRMQESYGITGDFEGALIAAIEAQRRDQFA